MYVNQLERRNFYLLALNIFRPAMILVAKYVLLLYYFRTINKLLLQWLKTIKRNGKEELFI